MWTRLFDVRDSFLLKCGQVSLTTCGTFFFSFFFLSFFLFSNRNIDTAFSRSGLSLSNRNAGLSLSNRNAVLSLSNRNVNKAC